MLLCLPSPGLAQRCHGPPDGGFELGGVDTQEDLTLHHIIPFLHVHLDHPAHHVGADVNRATGADVPAGCDGCHEVTRGYLLHANLDSSFSGRDEADG